MCRASTSRTDAGFTLLEMMVSVAILSLVLSTVPTFYVRLLPNYALRQFANDVANDSRRAVQNARRTGVSSQLLIDTNQQQLSVGGQTLQIPDGVSVELLADEAFGGFSDQKVSFFATGMTSGGVLLLSNENLSVSVKLDWVSGAIEVQQ